MNAFEYRPKVGLFLQKKKKKKKKLYKFKFTVNKMYNYYFILYKINILQNMFNPNLA